MFPPHHNLKPRQQNRPSLPHNYSFLPKKKQQQQQPLEEEEEDTTMMEEHPKTQTSSGLRRRSVHSNKKLPQAPTSTAAAAGAAGAASSSMDEDEEIDPLDPTPLPPGLTPPPPLQRRRSTTNFPPFEEEPNLKNSGLFGMLNWAFKLLGTAALVVCVVAVLNALPLRLWTKTTARNVYDVAIEGWKTVFSVEGWVRRGVQ